MIDAPLRIVLHRPRNSQNIGAAARAIANTSAGALWVVEPVGYDQTQAARLAAGADQVLDSMRVVTTLDEALADCVDVIMTAGRPITDVPVLDPRQAAQRIVAAPGPVALVFGDEVRGLKNRELARACAVATIPTEAKASLNLAQAVLVFCYEVMLARRERGLPAQGAGPAPASPREASEATERPPLREPAEERLITLLRERTQALLLSSGFLNPQQPDTILDELLRMLRRSQPSRREVELLLAASAQVARWGAPR